MITHKSNGRRSRDEKRQDSCLDPRIVQTGERTVTRVKVFFDGQERWITFLQVHILVRLIIARRNGGTGYVSFEELYPKAACCLKKAIDRPFGDKEKKVEGGKGDAFIEAGSRQQYRLKFEPRGRFDMTETVAELIGMEVCGVTVVSESQYKLLREIAEEIWEPRE
jgi:hypothetical protein